jgi:type VI secretion system protein ImpB
MEGISPALSYTVDNKLAGGEGQINVALNFNSMADFQPKNIIEQVEPLKKLFEARQRLNDLSAKLDGNDELDNLLSQIIQNTDQREKIAGELASSAPADDKS